MWDHIEEDWDACLLGLSPFRWIALVEHYFLLGTIGFGTARASGGLSGSSNLELVQLWDGYGSFHELGCFQALFVVPVKAAFGGWTGRAKILSNIKISLVNYVIEFEELKSLVIGIEEQNLKRISYSGRNLELQEVITMKKPSDLTQHIAAIIL